MEAKTKSGRFLTKICGPALFVVRPTLNYHIFYFAPKH